MTAGGRYTCQVTVGEIFKQKSAAGCNIEISKLIEI